MKETYEFTRVLTGFGRFLILGARNSGHPGKLVPVHRGAPSKVRNRKNYEAYHK